MHAKAILLASCLLATGFAAMFGTPVVHGATLINDKLVEETGPTSVLGGGDHVFVRFGNDAAFGVVYGTTANPNNVYLVAIKARYLGLAQAVDSQNRSVAQNVPIKIYTLYAVKLDSIVEYRDNSPRNNVADYGRVYNSTTGRFTNYFNRPRAPSHGRQEPITGAGPSISPRETSPTRTWQITPPPFRVRLPSFASRSI